LLPDKVPCLVSEITGICYREGRHLYNTKMNTLELHFSENELVQTSFSCSLLGANLKTVRGKSSGGYGPGVGTFQWTQSVQALTCLCLQSVLNRSSETQLSGETGSLASSLDFALSKPPTWMLDMFGCGISGEPIVRRIFRRINAEQKLPGPVHISVNQSFLGQVKIICNGEVCFEPKKIERILSSIRDSWKPARPPRVISQTIADENSPPTTFNPGLKSLRSVFQNEVTTMVQNCNIFARHTYQAVTKRMQEDLKFANLSCCSSLLDALGGNDLLPGERLGILNSNKLELQPIKAAVPLATYATVALFEHMKKFTSSSIEIDFSYQHAIELMHLILADKLTYTPDVVVLGIAPAALFSKHCHKFGYKPVMVVPGMSHRVLGSAGIQSAKKKKRKNHDFLMLNSDPSTSLMYFKRLKAKEKFGNGTHRVTHADPDEVFAALKSGDEDARAILFFPYYEINRLFNGCELIDVPHAGEHAKESVMFVHESLSKNKNQLSLLQRLIRNSWLTLREDQSEVAKAVDSISSYDNFLPFLNRSSGVFHLERPIQ
jgi:hypothetical protein